MSYTAEEIEKMRLAVAEADRRIRGDEAAARVEHMKPVRDFVKSKTFTNFESKLSELQPSYEANETVSVHINAILMILGNLIVAADQYIDQTLSTTVEETVIQDIEVKEKNAD